MVKKINKENEWTQTYTDSKDGCALISLKHKGSIMKYQMAKCHSWPNRVRYYKDYLYSK